MTGPMLCDDLPESTMSPAGRTHYKDSTIRGWRIEVLKVEDLGNYPIEVIILRAVSLMIHNVQESS